ncbi:hypothetical protein ABT56_18855 [Photobacterium aquae]|uniref:Uncharacterized protein n=1 Tax=Photobacterium aquae TaxID=1195763 RepID=A0A0J1JMV5_9GAMM|nr:hypothetical protein [Photobacterium aquae]KLV03497.1 hypothetical protein ABT56_18855 [Photobacterium aquae]
MKYQKGIMVAELAIYYSVSVTLVVMFISSIINFGSNYVKATEIKETSIAIKDGIELFYNTYPKIAENKPCYSIDKIPVKNVNQLVSEGYITSKKNYLGYDLTVKTYEMNGIKYAAGAMINVNLDSLKEARNMSDLIPNSKVKDDKSISIYYPFTLPDIDQRHFDFNTGCYIQ